MVISHALGALALLVLGGTASATLGEEFLHSKSHYRETFTAWQRDYGVRFGSEKEFVDGLQIFARNRCEL